MIKVLFSVVLGMFFLHANSQDNFNYYKVYELNISDLNSLTTNENFDFGYNFSLDSSKAIELGYYLWIENTWYKIVNDKEIFKVEEKSPLYFKIDKSNKRDLQIKDSLGSVYFYKVELLESYLVSELIYKTNLDVIENIAEAESIPSSPINDINDSDVINVASVELTFLNENGNVVNTDIESRGEEVLDTDLTTTNNVTNLLDEVAIDSSVRVEDVVLDKQDVNNVVADSINVIDELRESSFNFFLIQNVELPMSEQNGDELFFDLFAYYEKYFGVSLVSSSLNPSVFKFDKTSFEYQVTFFNDKEIEILEISEVGILKYKIISASSFEAFHINVRYIIF